MPGGPNEQDSQNPPAVDKLESEVRWVLERAGILMRSWTMSLNSADTFKSDDGVSARAFALLLIAALAFAVRGEAGGPMAAQATFTAMAAGLAIVLSAVLNVASKALGVTVRERVILSAYASTILIMIGYAVIATVGPNFNIYVEGTEWLFEDDILFAVLLASVLMLIGLILKSLLIDKGAVTRAGLFHAAVLTLGSGVIVLLVAKTSPKMWTTLVKCLSQSNPFSCFFQS